MRSYHDNEWLESKYETVSTSLRPWSFPDAKSSLDKAKELKKKGYELVLNGNKADIKDLEEAHEWAKGGFRGMTAGTRYFSSVKEYQDDENKVFYVRLGNRQTANLM